MKGKTENLTHYRQELKERILTVAMQMFRQQGIRAVKMDDIAKKLTISKRTLYEIYANKEELLLEGVKMRQQKNESVWQKVAENGNVMDVLLTFYHQQMNDLKGVSPLFFSDIQRFPKIINHLENLHERHNEQNLQFFQWGVKDGYFRKDVDFTLVSAFASGSLRRAMQSELYKRYDSGYIFRNVILLFMRGFCTEKGLAIIENLLEDNHD